MNITTVVQYQDRRRFATTCVDLSTFAGTKESCRGL